MRMIPVVLLAACLCVLTVSCVSLDQGGDQSTTTRPTVAEDAVQGAADTVDMMADIHPHGEIPQHFLPDEPAEIQRQEGDFDVNAYFTVLHHLTLEPGYTLDYLYIHDGMGGYPFVYARPSDQPPYASYDEYVAAVTSGAPDPTDRADYSDTYLDHVQTDDTREGYFEFAVLRIMDNQFYLWWHAGYNDATIVCDKESLERTLSQADGSFVGNMIPDSLRKKAAKLDLQPTVEFPDAGTAIVRLVTFSMWGGFEEVRMTISRDFPHRILETAVETLIEYDCGVSF